MKFEDRDGTKLGSFGVESVHVKGDFEGRKRVLTFFDAHKKRIFSMP